MKRIKHGIHQISLDFSFSLFSFFVFGTTFIFCFCFYQSNFNINVTPLIPQSKLREEIIFCWNCLFFFFRAFYIACLSVHWFAWFFFLLFFYLFIRVDHTFILILIYLQVLRYLLPAFGLPEQNDANASGSDDRWLLGHSHFHLLPSHHAGLEQHWHWPVGEFYSVCFCRKMGFV